VRIRYRVSQFWKALFVSPNQEQLAQARSILSPALWDLFQKMQPSEQAHSLDILERLLAQGETDPDLLTAALLHDVGKICYPLRDWERVLIVIGKGLFPGSIKRWGMARPVGWKRVFVVAENHAAWGAEIVATAGATPATIDIIRFHQDKLPAAPFSDELPPPGENLLYRLQILDDES
jgi:putative nucleotidyltransferase with HDIG domain